MNGIEQLLVSNVAAISVTGIFVYYLERKGERDKKTYDAFNLTMSNHLDHSTKVIKENSDMIRQASIGFQELCDAVKTLNGKKRRK